MVRVARPRAAPICPWQSSLTPSTACHADVLMVELAASLVRVSHAYIAAMDLRFWQKALREAERELDAAKIGRASCRERV